MKAKYLNSYTDFGRCTPPANPDLQSGRSAARFHLLAFATRTR